MAPGVSDATPRGRVSFKAIAKSTSVAQPNMNHLRTQMQNQQGGYRKSRKVSRYVISAGIILKSFLDRDT